MVQSAGSTSRGPEFDSQPWLTTICNTSLTESDALFWSLTALKEKCYTDIQADKIAIEKKRDN